MDSPIGLRAPPADAAPAPLLVRANCWLGVGGLSRRFAPPSPGDALVLDAGAKALAMLLLLIPSLLDVSPSSPMRDPNPRL
jgi:hypothetical protein